MPFQKGNQFGNRKGRPKSGDSLAEQIRAEGDPARRKGMIGRMWDIAAEPHGDVNARVKAAEWLAKHGWPEEARGQTTVETDGKITTVTHIHVKE